LGTRRWRGWPGVATVALGLAVTCECDRAAHAQTADYFATPWVVAPILPEVSNPGAPATTPIAPLRSGATSNLYAQALATQAETAPPVQYSLNIGIDETGTDNIGETESHRIADLSSSISAGGTVAADTQRLSGVLTATGVYQRNIVDTDLNQFSEYAYANGRSMLVPGSLYFMINGSVDDLARNGGGLQNPVLQSALNTHSYIVSGSPYWVTQIGDLGTNVVRYQIGQSWFSNNTGSVGPPGFGLAPITSSTYQSVREDFRAPGTLAARLMSDLSLSASEDDAGNSISGAFQQANGELMNEYEITRWASLIGGGGYEVLHDAQAPQATGQDPIWDFGGRVRPNADSSILLVYGRHDRISDFGGEVAWWLTPFTSFYAAYTDSLGSTQQTLIANNAGSVLSPIGAVSDVTFDHSTLIGVLDEAALNGAPGGEALGIPIGIGNNAIPLQDGLFRTKQLSASVQSTLDGNPLELTAYKIQSISVTPLLAPSFDSEGANLSWSPGISERLSGFALAGYAHVTGTSKSDVYSAEIGATYSLSDSLSLIARYDFILRETNPSSTGYLQNALTIALHKSFD